MPISNLICKFYRWAQVKRLTLFWFLYEIRYHFQWKYKFYISLMLNEFWKLPFCIVDFGTYNNCFNVNYFVIWLFNSASFTMNSFPIILSLEWTKTIYFVYKTRIWECFLCIFISYQCFLMCQPCNPFWSVFSIFLNANLFVCWLFESGS